MAVRVDRLRPRFSDTIAWPGRRDLPKRAQAAKQRAHQLVVPRHVALFIVIAAVVCAVSLIYLVQTSAVANRAYQIDSLKYDNEELARANETLKLEIAEFESLAAVEQVATDQLGMQPVNDVEYISVPQVTSQEVANAGSE